jgi:hypothetical protein
MPHKTLYFALLFAFSCSLAAQNTDALDAQNMDKYWAYRQRFVGTQQKGGFVDIGLGQGQSLPASGRAPSAHCGSYFFLRDSKCPLHEGNGLMIWSDGSYYLGYYIAMLSFEIRNLAAAKADINGSLYELFCALKAIERLDTTAERALGRLAATAENPPNGFFIRDDVPEDFYYLPKTQPERRFVLSQRHGYECTYSDYNCQKRYNPKLGGYVSQDQIIALLLGLATVAELLPEATYTHKGETFRLCEIAQMQTDRMIHYLIACAWQLRSPDGQKIPARWGGDVRAFSYGIARAGERICKKRFRPTYQTPKSRHLGKALHRTFQWAWGVQNARNYSMIYALAIINNDWTAARFAKRSAQSDQLLYSLWDAALNQKTLVENNAKAYWQAFLATAPLAGPCHNSPDCAAPEGWRSSDRWWQTANKNGNPYGFDFEFSGLDYLLAYNIYQFMYQKELPFLR